jgi:hypothetical protein
MSQPEPLSRDSEALSRVIELPVIPIEVWWRGGSMATPGGVGPTDELLLAVLRLEASELRALVGSGGQQSIAEPLRIPKGMLGGLPLEVVSRLVLEDDEQYRIDGSVFDPAPFARSPFSDGYWAPLSSTFALVYLYTR